MKKQTEIKETLTDDEKQFISLKNIYLKVSIQDKINCSFDSWYKLFRKYTIHSRIIPLNKTFIDYLKLDGLKLPKFLDNDMTAYGLDSDYSSDSMIKPNDDDSHIQNKRFNDDNNNSSDNSNNSNNNDNNDDIDYELMKDICHKIKDKIKVLKNKVVVKLNWSLPKDSVWINMETIECNNITQILLMLKASTFIQHDLFYPFHNCYDYNENIKIKYDDNMENNKDKMTLDTFQYKLILRKYSNLYRSREFRCFIYNNTIICISQRYNEYFEELQDNTFRNDIQKVIQKFFNNIIKDKFYNKHCYVHLYHLFNIIHILTHNNIYRCIGFIRG